MRARIPNAVFFATGAAARGEPIVPEAVFYHGRPRPALETPLAVRIAARPARFAIALFLVGWSGIIFQASFLQQVVIGAPVFEELAKFGPPLLVVSLLRVRTLWLRLPLAWLSGAAFGVMEHHVTYSFEEPLQYAERVLFHAASPGLSMLFWGAYEDLGDVRARWAATIPAMLFHWANNFGAILLALASVFAERVAVAAGMGMSLAISSTMLLLTAWAIASRASFEAQARAALERAMPRVRPELQS